MEDGGWRVEDGTGLIALKPTGCNVWSGRINAPLCLSSPGRRKSEDEGVLEVLCVPLLCHTHVWVNGLVLTKPEKDSGLVAAQISHPRRVFIEMQGTDLVENGSPLHNHGVQIPKGLLLHIKNNADCYVSKPLS